MVILSNDASGVPLSAFNNTYPLSHIEDVVVDVINEILDGGLNATLQFVR